MQISCNEHAMHKAILWIEVDVTELLSTGECSGNIGHKIQRFPLTITGINKSETLRKVGTLIEEIKEKCKSL